MRIFMRDGIMVRVKQVLPFYLFTFLLFNACSEQQ